LMIVIVLKVCMHVSLIRKMFNTSKSTEYVCSDLTGKW
jgi:hypothetical protein